MFFQQGGNLGPQDGVQLRSADIFIAFDTFFQPLDDFQGGLHPYIGGDEGFLEIVKYILIDGRLSQNSL